MAEKNIGIHVGAEQFQGEPLSVAEAIALILKVGAEAHTEQETIRAALRALTDVAEVKNVTIQNSSIEM